MGAISIATLMGNDAGGDGKQFYGIHQTNATIAATTATTSKGATITVAGSDILYDPSGSAAIQALPAGQPLGDTFTYTIRLANGALSTGNVTVTVAGANDAAVFGGVNTGSVREDGTQAAGGTLTVSDVDTGEAGFQAVAAADLAKTFGTFSFDQATGAWGYTLNNTAANVQALNSPLRKSPLSWRGLARC